MERVLGIGGYFLRATDPAALNTWYHECLGMDADENGLWQQGSGPTVFATFESQLRRAGADVAEETQDMDGVGRFGWVTDPEGDRIELWQPA